MCSEFRIRLTVFRETSFLDAALQDTGAKKHFGRFLLIIGSLEYIPSIVFTTVVVVYY